MKEQIEATLRTLVEEPLTDMWRYAGCQKFEFGVQQPARNRRGEEVTQADLDLVVSCDWRITGPEGYVVSSDDFGPEGARNDGEARPFYHLIATSPPVVEAVVAKDEGGVRIQMSLGYTLEMQPIVDLEPDDEQWRFMARDEQLGHVVLWGSGQIRPDCPASAVGLRHEDS